MANDIVEIDAQITLLKPQFQSALSDSAIRFEQEKEFALQCLQNNDFLMQTGKKNKSSLAAAIMNIAAIGISLNPAKKQAYLVPRSGAVCLDISYMGLMFLATSCGSIKYAQSHIVYSNDRFKMQGLGKAPEHIFDPFSKERGEIIGAYCVIETPSGSFITHTMTIGEIDAIRDRSDGYKAFKANKIKSCPWTTDYKEMARKTVVKSAAKYWPASPRLQEAIHLLNSSDEGIQEIKNQSSQSSSDVDHEKDQIYKDLCGMAQDATTDEQALGIWKANNGKLQGTKYHGMLKSVVMQKRQEIRDSQVQDVEFQEHQTSQDNQEKKGGANE